MPRFRLPMTIFAALLLYRVAQPSAWSAEGPVPVLVTQLETMKKLDGFLGEWLGDGWFTFGKDRLGIVSYDDRTGKFLMRSYFRGQITDLDADVPRAGILVGLTKRADGPLARVTTDVTTDGIWREWSESSTDGGQTWVKSYEIVMKRLPAS